MVMITSMQFQTGELFQSEVAPMIFSKRPGLAAGIKIDGWHSYQKVG